MQTLKNDIVRARVSSELKDSAAQVLDGLGMSMTEAIRLFLTQVSLRQEFPIELKIPNKTTLKAMSDDVTEDSYDSVDALFNEVLSDSQH
ncbi:DNA-damage-inducible protein J [Bathymodiolus platifrons methanotrophic gill symbiont]|uniref:type II toxin-antitoxin system RelB/DinJ family antitoxin n=1 Tax=Bathymodiolus platifrons methanotrophic gill symbiont TaxID=113268 RepID=UPI000B40E463|nr:type II toxin-antitoxin system RelB/DinJ family antitoxin [Bathymodiolus platifrons methanotrophic gill symbiont]GAW87565.1 DNA-damage-inducible protein J [Bathymodiolus platifrons methanotrophic gill symbiont]GFO77197.1 DNA-damage-inducible protein J [Bathymodiolus platifrons methanotrophic gill symbiont]